MRAATLPGRPQDYGLVGSSAVSRAMDEDTSAIGEAALVRGRDAAGRSAWVEAYASLSEADGASTMRPADLEVLASAAYLTGHVQDSIGTLRRAYRLHADAGEVEAAVRSAFWLGFHLINRREFGQAEGWLARAGRLVDELGEEGAANGYLLLPTRVPAGRPSRRPRRRPGDGRSRRRLRAPVR